MADKKGVILIRFPKDLADRLRRASFMSDTPIKDIVSEIVGDNLDEWLHKHAVTAFKETITAIDSLQAEIEKYAAARSISAEQASDELGITELVTKGMAEIEAIRKADPDTLDKKIREARRGRKAAESELSKPAASKGKKAMK